MKQQIASKEVLIKSQEEEFPYIVEKFGLKIVVQRGVFSPKYFNGYEIFTRNFPPIEGEDILEIGSGTGITGLYLAKNGAKKVILVDINTNSVKNSTENALRNNISNVEVRESDIFSAIQEKEKFDTIYWNMPFLLVPSDYVFGSVLERALFDPGYHITESFLQEAPQFLNQNGRLLIGWGDSENHEFGNPDTLTRLAKKFDYEICLLHRENSTEIHPVIFELYELRRRLL